MSIHDFDRLKHLDSKNLNWFVVNWCLGSTCNFACSYCPESLHDGRRPWHSTENIKAFVDKVKAFHPEKQIYFEFTGGEVTLNKDFIEICKFCTEHGVKVGFITNGSRTLRWWEENKHYFDHVVMSFHSEFAKPDHFCKVIEILRLEVRTHVNIMMNPDQWDLCMDVAEKVKDIGNASIALQPLIHDLASELYDYTPEQHKILNDQHELIGSKIKWVKGFDYYRGAMKAVKNDGSFTPRTAHSFIAKNTNNWLGWECFAGVEQLIIDIDGSVWRGWCRVGGRIGFINDPNLTLPTNSTVCNKNLCHCNFDIMSTKIRTKIGV
jgi:MoaA/NifB/PqqE/SkfB family radical SAM enzyme